MTAAFRCLSIRVLASMNTSTNFRFNRSRTATSFVSAALSRRHHGHQLAPKSSNTRLSSRVACDTALSIKSSALAFESNTSGPIARYSVEAAKAVPLCSARKTKRLANFIK